MAKIKVFDIFFKEIILLIEDYTNVFQSSSQLTENQRRIVGDAQPRVSNPSRKIGQTKEENHRKR